jgi:TolB protein
MNAMRRILFSLVLLPLAWPLWGGTLDITITGGAEGAAPIAVVPFGWAGSGMTPGANIGQIVAADLKRCGRFRLLAEQDMVARPTQASQVEFRDWRALGMDHLVVGNVTGTGPNGYQVTFALFDVYRGEQMLSYEINFGERHLRAAAHRIADMIYEKLTGQPGAFNTRIAYVTSIASGQEQPTVALQVADADGFNPQTIVESKDPIMSPAWSPDGSRIAYVSFEGSQPSIYVQEIASGKRRKIASYPGINGAPAWSPDGSRLALTLSKDGNPDIYVYELQSGSLKKLTDHYAIDTEASWSPDGSTLVFTSDRGGKQQVYRMSSSGGEARRISFEGVSNAKASYSPDGKSLALEVQTDRGFCIGLLDLASGTTRVLTEGGSDETPRFAPNGSMIIYASKSSGRATLAAVSVDGRVKQRLQLQAGDVREPAWSPLMK